ncbi:MAG: phage major capsid protein [Limnohabitans sp.]
MPDLELKELLEKQNKAFADFRDANDARLKALEAKGTVDPLLEEKVDKANKEISDIAKKMAEIEKKMNRPGGGSGQGQTSPEAEEHKAAFGSFLRKGREDGLRDLERKALNITTDEDGGYAVPTEIDTDILRLMSNESPMRRLCTVRGIGNAEYKKLVNLGGASSGWVDEDDARPETNAPKLAAITPYMGEIYSNPAATQQMLDDVFFNAETWLSEEVAIEFSEQENLAFLSGNGTKKPKGILAYTAVTTADATRAFGQLQYKETASATAVTGDELIDLVYLLRSKYRSGAAWMMNSLTLAAVRKLKDTTTGQYLWAPGLQAGQPSQLLGYAAEENEDMADIATGAVAAMFGNFKRGYMIVDRMGSRTLRDPYTNKPYVHFYTTKRVGGMLMDSLAIKLLKQK